MAAEKAAHEAGRATDWAIVATLLSAVGLGFIMWSLWQTGGALGEARRGNRIAMKANARATRQAVAGGQQTTIALSHAETANKLAQEMARRQLRAYVSVTEFEIFRPEGGPPKVEIRYKNGGQTPALDCRSYAQLLFFEGGDRNLEPDTPIPPGAVSQSVLIGGAEFNDRITLTNFSAVADRIRAGEIVLFIVGWIKYTDVFDVNHITNFRLFADGGTIDGRVLAFAPGGNNAD